MARTPLRVLLYSNLLLILFYSNLGFSSYLAINERKALFSLKENSEKINENLKKLLQATQELLMAQKASNSQGLLSREKAANSQTLSKIFIAGLAFGGGFALSHLAYKFLSYRFLRKKDKQKEK